MNYIDIKEAIEKTGKSERTIRRLFSNADSKPYIQRKGNKTLIEVNYLFSIYETKKEDKKEDKKTAQAKLCHCRNLAEARRC